MTIPRIMSKNHEMSLYERRLKLITMPTDDNRSYHISLRKLRKSLVSRRRIPSGKQWRIYVLPLVMALYRTFLKMRCILTLKECRY